MEYSLTICQRMLLLNEVSLVIMKITIIEKHLYKKKWQAQTVNIKNNYYKKLYF